MSIFERDMHIQMHTCLNAHLCAYVNAYTYMYTHVYMSIFTRVYMHKYIYINTHTPMWPTVLNAYGSSHGARSPPMSSSERTA